MTGAREPRVTMLRLDENGEVYEAEVDLSKSITVATGWSAPETPEARYWTALHNEHAIAMTKAFCAAVESIKAPRGGIRFHTPEEGTH